MAVTSPHMLQYLREAHLDWIEHYMRSRRSGYHSLLRLLQHFAERHGFSRQRICRQKKSQEELEVTRIAFGKQFQDKHPGIDMDVLYNSDETGMYYDMCPNTIWAIRGGGSYDANSERHSYRMTALLTVRGDGKKLPILFIIRGEPGGDIETNEFPDYPPEHFYAMQKKAWMNGIVWSTSSATSSNRTLRTRPYCSWKTLTRMSVKKPRTLLARSWEASCVRCLPTARLIVSP
ncbi:hypothetical protein DYB26_015142 [Aphanomyces astaci]|uniref:DDE-1 domain-containing protein n=1 Tax=Aphanomyces astaci TaxID=112090 RepID=A0A3R6XLJ5_APHAT|nr:hypothetical protein DYB26_015142 [Aphanomyces astaci]